MVDRGPRWLVVNRAAARSVTLSNAAVPACASAQDFATGKVCFYNASTNLVVARSGVRPVTEAKTFAVTLTAAPATTSVNFVCNDGATSPGQAIYVTGNLPQLGSWQPAAAWKLIPVRYPRWSRTLYGLQARTRVEWKCLRRAETGTTALGQRSGANSALTTGASGFSGTTRGTLVSCPLLAEPCSAARSAGRDLRRALGRDRGAAIDVERRQRLEHRDRRQAGLKWSCRGRPFGLLVRSVVDQRFSRCPCAATRGKSTTVPRVVFT